MKPKHLFFILFSIVFFSSCVELAVMVANEKLDRTNNRANRIKQKDNTKPQSNRIENPPTGREINAEPIAKSSPSLEDQRKNNTVFSPPAQADNHPEVISSPSLNLADYEGYPQIELLNPSFDMDKTGHSRVPLFWNDCGDANQSPPDIHSMAIAYFGVEQYPMDGNNFLGLVCRADGTHEGISQVLPLSLEKGEEYLIAMYLAQSKKLISGNRATLVNEFYDNPSQLKIWGGDIDCSKEELLAQTSFVNHDDWKIYEFNLLPKENYDYITLEIRYTGQSGNILIDAISPIIHLSGKK